MERIVDIVFAGEPNGRGRRIAIASGAVLGVVAVVGATAGRLGPSAGPWSAEMAARLHEALAAERAVELAPAAPPPVASHVSAATETRAPRPRLGGPAAARHARAAPAAPAQAGALAAAADAPADFTGTAFVVGSAATYAGGSTMRSGTSRAPVTGDVAPAGTAAASSAAGRSLARPVSLDPASWPCNNGDHWPRDADALPVDEQTVVIRVTVRLDGRAERVDVLKDPGFGFGDAARACALTARFGPARDAAGRAIAAVSPSLNVHFLR